MTSRPGDRPIVLLVVPDGSDPNLPVALAEGWRIVASTARNVVPLGKEVHPHLIVVRDDAQTVLAARKIRGANLPLASCAVLRIGKGAGGSASLAGWDGFVADGADDILVRAMREWTPVPREAHERVAEQFGSAAIDPMRARLRDALMRGLGLLEAGEASCSAEAHRLAGICGMLGFQDAGAAWRSVFEGEESAFADAWRTSRLTISTIDRIALSQLQH